VTRTSPQERAIRTSLPFEPAPGTVNHLTATAYMPPTSGVATLVPPKTGRLAPPVEP